MQQPRKISARRHLHARKRLFDRARPAHPRTCLQHQHALSRSRQVSSTRQPIMSGADNDHVPSTRRKLTDRSGKANFAEHGSGRGGQSVSPLRKSKQKSTHSPYIVALPAVTPAASAIAEG